MACKIISHRGANRRAPQNTIPAFEHSIKIGVDGFETDIHLSKDGVPVVCHNYTIDETSTGQGEIRNMTLEELRQYDFGSYFHEKYAGTKLPTLEEFLALCETADIEIMNIEIKPPLDGNMEIVRKTLDAVKAHGLFDRLLISSFDANVLVECKKVDPDCKTGLLYCPKQKEFSMLPLVDAELNELRRKWNAKDEAKEALEDIRAELPHDLYEKLAKKFEKVEFGLAA